MAGDVPAAPPAVGLRHRRYAADLASLPIRAEVAPYGSCHLQAVSNLLAWSGVPDAPERICPSMGVSRPADGVLSGGERWIGLAGHAFGVTLAERHAEDASAAAAVEAGALGDGAPVAAVVDSFHIPSPYTGRGHLAHCVLLVARDRTGVTVIDPMNRPAQTRYDLAAWTAMRSAGCVDRFRMFTCPGRARRHPSAAELLRILASDTAAHREHDARELAGFVAWAQTTTTVLNFDVAGVAAERSYLAGLLAGLAARHRFLRATADSVASLARRWYLLHSLGLAQPDAGGPQRDRLVSLLRSTARGDTRISGVLAGVHPMSPSEEP